MPVEKIDQLLFAGIPVQSLFEVCEVARTTDPVLVKGYARPLIGNGAAFAKLHFPLEGCIYLLRFVFA